MREQKHAALHDSSRTVHVCARARARVWVCVRVRARAHKILIARYFSRDVKA